MSTIIHNPYATLSGSSNATLTCPGSATLTYASGGAVWTDRGHIDDVKDYIDFAFQMMGIDMDFDKFKAMTEAEKKAMIRDQKINKIIE